MKQFDKNKEQSQKNKFKSWKFLTDNIKSNQLQYTFTRLLVKHKKTLVAKL